MAAVGEDIRHLPYQILWVGTKRDFIDPDRCYIAPGLLASKRSGVWAPREPANRFPATPVSGTLRQITKIRFVLESTRFRLTALNIDRTIERRSRHLHLKASKRWSVACLLLNSYSLMLRVRANSQPDVASPWW